MLHIRTIIVSIVILCLDLVTKILFYDRQWASDWGFISAHFNEGIARSIPIPMLVVVLVTLAVIAALSRLYYQKQIARWIYSLILAGALGNLYDRVVLGGVRDFIDLGWFPVFNIADIAITLGAIGIIIRTLSPGKFAMKK